jgi:hypothetical protein
MMRITQNHEKNPTSLGRRSEFQSADGQRIQNSLHLRIPAQSTYLVPHLGFERFHNRKTIFERLRMVAEV